MLKSNGPSIEPWGTIDAIVLHILKQFPTSVIFQKYSLKQALDKLVFYFLYLDYFF